MIQFGVAGNSLSFYAEGYKSTVEAASWCKSRGIDIFEYSFGKGISVSDKTAAEIGNAFKSQGVGLSVHAPYYINFANTDPEMIEKSIGYVLNSARKLTAFGGERVVFHPATQGKAERAEAVNLTRENLKKLIARLEEEELSGMKFCVETMGKIRQIGDLEEIISFSLLSPMLYPCIDFGHLNARSFGSLKTERDFNAVVEKLSDYLPDEKVQNMHIHFSKIMYGTSGEIKHLTFADETYGPEFLPLAYVLKKRNLTPVIICESDGTQAEDAMCMKRIYQELII